MTLVKRSIKGSALTHQELDSNFDHVIALVEAKPDDASELAYTPAVDAGALPSTSGPIATFLNRLKNYIDTTFLKAAEYAFSVVSPNVNGTTIIDCQSKLNVSRKTTITQASGSGSGYLLAFTNMVNGTTLTYKIKNSHSGIVNVILPADAATLIYGNGDNKQIPVAAGKRLLLGVTYDGEELNVTKIVQ